jgi:GNAT superfamily N-acetyltransferase
MSYRLERLAYLEGRRESGAANRAALLAITVRGEVPGILAYESDTPVGWCSVAPRDQFPWLDRSPHSKRCDAMPDAMPDDAPVWSIVCFHVGSAHRRRGVMSYLVRAAIEYVRERGGGVIEAYPRRDEEGFTGGSGWAGLLPVFVAAGFVEVARPSPTRSIVRCEVRP